MLFARQRGLGICPPKPSVEQFHLADGNAMVPVGDALAEWSYMRARAGKTTVELKVLKSSSWPVVLGLKILKRTRTLDLNWHRLQTIATQAEDFSCVHVLGRPSSTVADRLERLPTSAVAATISEVNLISNRFVQERGLRCE